ncbi:MAG: HhH-GPD-type base excision DNA repair protein [Gaiellaceae bacterium]
MPTALWFTDDPKACELLAKEPFALLVGFAIDQQVTVQKAFAGPHVLKERAGTLDPRKLAAMDLAEVFATKPAIHRFPGAMAQRVRDLASVVADDYDGDASRIWRDAADSKDLRKRIAALPGFGEMKIKSLSAVLAKQFGVKAAEEIAPDHPTLGDVNSPEELDRYQTWKRAYKKAAKGS